MSEPEESLPGSVSVEIEFTPEGIRGVLLSRVGERRPFQGWVGLAAAIQNEDGAEGGDGREGR